MKLINNKGIVIRSQMCHIILFVSLAVLVFFSCFFHVLLLVKVPLMVFLHYEVYVDMFVPLPGQSTSHRVPPL